MIIKEVSKMANTPKEILDEDGVQKLVNAITADMKKVTDALQKKMVEMDELATNKIVNPENFPLSKDITEVVIDAVLEVGGLSRKTGELEERSDSVRSKDYIQVSEGYTYTITNGMGYRTCVCCYNYNKEFLVAWNGEYSYQYVSDGGSIIIPPTATYIRFYCSSTSDTTTKFILKSVQSKMEVTEFVSQHFSNGGYRFRTEEIDPNLYELQLYRDCDEFTIFDIKAPSAAPHEATLTLKCSGNNTRQFADISCMKYDKSSKGQVCIICQKRGSETPLPYFFVGFNDGEGAGRVQKLRVNPDAIPIRFTDKGIEVRRNNNYDNDWTAEETVTVNLASLHDDVEELKSTSGGGGSYDPGVPIPINFTIPIITIIPFGNIDNIFSHIRKDSYGWVTIHLDACFSRAVVNKEEIMNIPKDYVPLSDNVSYHNYYFDITLCTGSPTYSQEYKSTICINGSGKCTIMNLPSDTNISNNLKYIRGDIKFSTNPNWANSITQ